MSRERFDPNTPVLLAESDQAIRDAFGPIFEEFQFHSVTIEEEGYGVLRADNSNSYGLIVLGSSLEGMSVPKVVAALRSGGENSDTPILIMYNAKDEGIVEKVMEAGATASLKWPVKKSTFHKTLDDLLDRRIGIDNIGLMERFHGDSECQANQDSCQQSPGVLPNKTQIPAGIATARDW